MMDKRISKERIFEILRFGIVGTVAMAIHYGIFYVLLPTMDKNIAYTIGYFIGFVCNFFMSSYFTFQVKPTWTRLFRFGCSHGINFFVYIGLFNFFCWTGVPPKWAPLPVYAIAIPVSYLLVRFALKNKQKKTLLLLLSFCSVNGASAQGMLTDHYNVASLDLAAGLPHNNVNQIFADSYGFIWISTYGGGAVRYDGYSFMKPVSSQTEVASNSCKGMAEDNFHRLWVAYDEGTVVIDLHSMNYVTPVYGKGDISRQLMQSSVKVYHDSRGCIWQVTRDSVFRYSFNKNGSIEHVSRCKYQGNTPDITISDIEQNGTVWINIENGLYRLSETNEKLVRQDIAPAMQQLQGIYVTDLLKRGSAVWISTNLGLYVYDQYASTMTVYRHTTAPGSISHDYTTALAVTPDGRLVVGSLRGVNIFDEQKGTFEHWNTTSAKPLPSDFVHCMLIRDGQIWIGTETAGIVKLSPQPFMLRYYAHNDANAASLSANPVNAMYVEPNGTLWAGTVEGGLNRKSADGLFTHWTTHNSQLPHNSVSVLVPDGQGRLWIGTWGGGVCHIPLSGIGGVQRLSVPSEMEPITNYIGSLAYDKYNDGLWIGSNDGVFFYDFKTQTLSDPFKGNREVRGCIGALVDKDGQLWLGCLSGVCIVNLRQRQANGEFNCRRLRNKLDHPESSVVDKISCFCEAKDGTLWLGSSGYGLYRRLVDAKTHKESFEVLTTDQGLVNNSVKGIVEDVQGRLWITTDNGLSVYDPRTRTFNNYKESDGLSCQQFYWNSAVKGPDDAIYLGSMNGLMEIRGENMGASYPVHLTFTRLLVDNQLITAANNDIIDADISHATTIHLHESNKSMVIDFSTLTYMGGAQEHYCYRLKGFEDEWIPLNPGEHSVRYTSLKSGYYVFEVRNMDVAEADQQVISIRIDVTPYFWKTWWFILFMAFAVLAAILWLQHRRMEAWRRQEAEKLLVPIRKAIDESDNPEQLQTYFQNILGSFESVKKSLHRSVEVDNEATAHKLSFMERATQIMEAHYMDSDFGIDQFAEAIGMSRSQLSKRLNAEMGISIGQFIRSYRLNVAKKLLLENVAKRNITEIAYKVGFNDPKYFTRCFTNHYGSSPSTYIEK